MEAFADQSLASLLKVVDSMPLSWVCVDCGKETLNVPCAEPPYAIRTEAGRIAGRVCEACYNRTT